MFGAHYQKNPAAIELLENNIDKINWNKLVDNPNAMHLLKKNKDKIYWPWISENLSIFEIDQKRINDICNFKQT